mmetsp:Transcript_112903/g.224720  ORF Transcript_112903/g.224720 Transcript_112903/m.224720 type:complete len:424 (+) Transcript_112903:889-2160(+)
MSCRTAALRWWRFLLLVLDVHQVVCCGKGVQLLCLVELLVGLGLASLHRRRHVVGVVTGANCDSSIQQSIRLRTGSFAPTCGAVCLGGVAGPRQPRSRSTRATRRRRSGVHQRAAGYTLTLLCQRQRRREGQYPKLRHPQRKARFLATLQLVLAVAALGRQPSLLRRMQQQQPQMAQAARDTGGGRHRRPPIPFGQALQVQLPVPPLGYRLMVVFLVPLAAETHVRSHPWQLAMAQVAQRPKTSSVVPAGHRVALLHHQRSLQPRLQSGVPVHNNQPGALALARLREPLFPPHPDSPPSVARRRNPLPDLRQIQGHSCVSCRTPQDWLLELYLQCQHSTCKTPELLNNPWCFTCAASGWSQALATRTGHKRSPCSRESCVINPGSSQRQVVFLLASPQPLGLEPKRTSSLRVAGLWRHSPCGY